MIGKMGKKEETNTSMLNMKQELKHKKDHSIRICITGGACAGKTTAISSI
jgi:uridine kinase